MNRLLADENFPSSVARQLAAEGYDLELAALSLRSFPDVAVLCHARESRRALLTFDADFGDLIFLHGEAPPPAVFYFRLHPVVLPELYELAHVALQDFREGYFVVVERDSVRTRAFPAVQG